MLCSRHFFQTVPRGYGCAPQLLGVFLGKSGAPESIVAAARLQCPVVYSVSQGVSLFRPVAKLVQQGYTGSISLYTRLLVSNDDEPWWRIASWLKMALYGVPWHVRRLKT